MTPMKLMLDARELIIRDAIGIMNYGDANPEVGFGPMAWSAVMDAAKALNVKISTAERDEMAAEVNRRRAR